MPPKRKVRRDSEDEICERRVTRSTATLDIALVGLEVGDSSPPRKRKRIPTDSEIENGPTLQVSKPKRTYGRRAAKHFGDDRSKKGFEIVEEKNCNAVSDCPYGSDTPRRSRRRAVLDCVEIVNVKGLNDISIAGKKTSPISVPLTLQADLVRSTTKMAALSVAEDHNRMFPKWINSSPNIPLELPARLPSHLHECLERQKQAVLDAFHDPPLINDKLANDNGEIEEPSTNVIALQQIGDLLSGSIERGEGNSCLLIGPSGSGKSKIFEKAIGAFEEDYRPIVIRLDGYIQHTDRLALREIARQVVNQTGSKTFESLEVDDDEDNPFDDSKADDLVGGLPPPAHLPSLIATLPTLSRPVVVLLDAFHIFTEQPRQALLYCLLDTVQSCRANSPSQRGLAVVGLTPHVDVVNFLEKRVKSRFSHRMIRAGSSRRIDDWTVLLRNCLRAVSKGFDESILAEWRVIWECSVNTFLQDRSVKDILNDMFGISRDVRNLLRVMTNSIAWLKPSSPYLTSQVLRQSVESQSNKAQPSYLMRLDYPSLSLCIAAQHARTAGHDSFTFEMLNELFVTQVRTSSAAPVVLGGGSIGMVNVGRRVLNGAFEELVQKSIFTQAAPSAVNIGREFVKYRCTVERDDVKKAVERVGQTNLKKWFGKAQ